MSSSCVSRAYGLSTWDVSETRAESSTSTPAVGEFRVSEPSSTTGLCRRVSGAASAFGGGAAAGDPIDILATLLPGLVLTRRLAALFGAAFVAMKSAKSWPHAGHAGV